MANYLATKEKFRQDLFNLLNEFIPGDQCDVIIDEACDRFNESWEGDQE